VLEGAPKQEEQEELSLEYAVSIAQKLVESGQKPTDAAKQAALMTGFKKNEIYKELL
jgi:16S rRNA (cytidine1402-2'-O)-methyltransferase